MQESQVTAPARLCNICLDLDFASIYQSKDIFRLSDEERANATHFVALFHQSLGSLRANSEFCDFCQLVQQCIDLDGNEQSGNDSAADFTLYLSSYTVIGGLQVVAIDQHSSLIKGLIATICLYVEEGNPLASTIKGRRIIPSPRSPAVIGQIKDWMNQPSGVQKRNETDHQPPAPVTLPTRAIQIVDNGKKAKLCITQNTTGQYAALSHCWGSQQPLTLTCANMEELELGIPVAELPQTFQDAVWLAHQLGIQYIWIDSLCILQDDHDDWVKESGKMCDVYRNSTLTIAATRAAGSFEGFLGERVDRKYVSIPFHAGGISGHALAFGFPPHVMRRRWEYCSMREEPLSSRGWAFQERCLSRKILHFCTDQIWFEKKPSLRAEDGTIRTLSMCFSGEDGRDMDDTGMSRGLSRRDWLEVVEMYSKRKLSHEEDRLPAIAGLATLYSPSSVSKQEEVGFKSQYMAGLWADRMIQGMSWKRDARGPEGTRPKKYHWPTWLWVSINGAVDYNLGRRWKPSGELATIQNVHVELESPHSPFGSVVNAWIQMKALLFPIALSNQFPELFMGKDGKTFFIQVTWDAESDQRPEEGKTAAVVGGETDLFAVPVFWTGRGDYPSRLSLVFFLILKRADQYPDPAGKSEAFTRVGAGDAMWSLGDNGKFCNVGIQELVTDRWERAKDMGKLQEIRLL